MLGADWRLLFYFAFKLRRRQACAPRGSGQFERNFPQGPKPEIFRRGFRQSGLKPRPTRHNSSKWFSKWPTAAMNGELRSAETAAKKPPVRGAERNETKEFA